MYRRRILRTFHIALDFLTINVFAIYIMRDEMILMLLFWAQMALASLVVISRSKKVSIFRAHPFQWPSKLVYPQQNHYVPHHINNR
jgi:hypothetical protein